MTLVGQEEQGLTHINPVELNNIVDSQSAITPEVIDERQSSSTTQRLHHQSPLLLGASLCVIIIINALP